MCLYFQMPCKTSGMQFIKLLKDRVPYTFRKFILLYFSAFLFVISVCTSNWFVCSLEVKTGVWSICYHTAPFWHCIAFETSKFNLVRRNELHYDVNLLANQCFCLNKFEIFRSVVKKPTIRSMC